MNCDLRFTIWKKTLAVLAMLVSIFGLHAQTTTPFYGTLRYSDGRVITNAIVMYAWPPSQNGITVVGTNIIFGTDIITNTPDASGYFSNSAYANTYAVKIPSLSSSIFAFAVLPNTTNVLNLAQTFTNVAVVFINASNYSWMTNELGFAPATNTTVGIYAALGFAPQPASTTLSNLTAGTTFALTNNGVIELHDALGQLYRTNTFTHATLFIDTNQNIFQDGIQLLTNSAAFDAAGDAIAAMQSATNFTKSYILQSNNFPVVTGDVTNAGTNFYLVSLINAGTAAKVTYDLKGRIVSTNNLTVNDIINVPITNGQPATLTLNSNTAPFVWTTNLLWMNTVYTNGGYRSHLRFTLYSTAQAWGGLWTSNWSGQVMFWPVSFSGAGTNTWTFDLGTNEFFSISNISGLNLKQSAISP